MHVCIQYNLRSPTTKVIGNNMCLNLIPVIDHENQSVTSPIAAFQINDLFSLFLCGMFKYLTGTFQI